MNCLLSAAGWKSGTKITYKPTKEYPKYIVFVIKEKSHPNFTRDKNNLIYQHKMPASAAFGKKNGNMYLNPHAYIHVKHLSQELITIDCIKEKLAVGSRHVIKGRGMPLNEKQTEFGDLIVTIVAAPASNAASYS